MHKKFFVLFVALFVVAAGMSFGQAVTQTFTMNVTVSKYLEVNSAYVLVSKSRTIPGVGDGIPAVYPTWAGNMLDAVYSNTGFTISYAGNNPATDGFPILAKLEMPRGDRYDRLQTRIQIKNKINEGGADYERHDMRFDSGPDGASAGTYSVAGFNSGSFLTFNNAPHDGELRVEWFFDGTLPHKSPDFGPDNPWNESADAGLYTCTLVATYAVI